jgi:acetamidase/formamidase
MVVETQDAHGGTITDEGVVYENLAEVLQVLGGANPVTGPIALDSLRAGDCLKVEILDIEGAPETGFGYMNTTPTLHPDLSAKTTIVRRDGDSVMLPTARGPVAIPYRPMIGTLGVAPASGRIESFAQRPDILGNVDLLELGTGAEVVLRANVDGGMLSLGDAHLTQGDAEIHRSAIETHADVTLSLSHLDVSSACFVELPQINTASRLGSVAPGPGHLEDLVRAAYDDLAGRLHRFHGFSLGDAYRLLGAAGRVRIGQVVPPVYSAMAMIKRSYVEDLSS